MSKISIHKCRNVEQSKFSRVFQTFTAKPLKQEPMTLSWLKHEGGGVFGAPSTYSWQEKSTIKSKWGTLAKGAKMRANPTFCTGLHRKFIKSTIKVWENSKKNLSQLGCNEIFIFRKVQFCIRSKGASVYGGFARSLDDFKHVRPMELTLWRPHSRETALLSTSLKTPLSLEKKMAAKPTLFSWRQFTWHGSFSSRVGKQKSTDE